MKDELDRIVSEYRRFQRAGRSPPESKFCLPDGSVMELCHTNGSDWTLCVLRPGDGALTPVAVGDDIAAVMRRYSEVLEGWQPALWPPLSVVIEGVTRVFMPAGMSLLLGVVELTGGALLLGVLRRAGKSCVALLHVGAHGVIAVHVGRPTDLRSVDVDGLLELQGLQAGAIQAQTKALTVALLAAFARLLVRALKPRKRAGPRRRGVGSVLLFLWILVQLVRRGSEDLYGRLRDIHAQIKALLPGVDLPRDALGDVLALMLETRTCLVSRDGAMLWLIRVSTLNSLESALHQKFCAEAPGTVADVEEFVRLCGSDTPPERSKHRAAEKPTMEAQHSGPPHRSSAEGVEGANAEPPVLLSFVRMLLERTANALMLKNTGVIEPSGSEPAPPPIKE